jgi:beta-lactamase class A
MIIRIGNRNTDLLAGVLCTIFLLSNAPGLLADKGEIAAIKAQIESLSAISGGDVGVAVEHLESGHGFSVHGDEQFPLASTYKVGIAAYLMHLVDQGKHSLDDMITVQSRQMSPGGMPIAHFFPHEGISLSLYNLLEVMLTESSNTATDVILELVGGGKSVTNWLQQQGIKDIRIDRTTASLIRDYLKFPYPEDPNISLRDQYATLQGSLSVDEFEAKYDRPEMYADFLADPRDQASPNAMLSLLGKIWRDEIVSPGNSQIIRDIMARCRTGVNRLKGRMPAGTVVAHKTGTIGGTLNDVGAITLPGGGGHVLIAVYVKSSTLGWESRELAIAEIARTVYDFYLLHPELRSPAP